MASTDAVNTITEALKETDELPRKQITDIIEVLGAEVALELLAETQRVQAEGGLEVRDGTRRRTDGGVYFSLAKARLPKTDRNRIFRIRPPKPPGSETAEERDGGAGAPAGAAKDGGVRPDARASRDGDRRAGSAATLPLVARDSGAAGRRRVVEIEVLRAKPSPPQAPAGMAPPAPPPRPAEERPAPVDTRPVRRIVVAAPREEPPPATPEAARDRIRGVLRGLAVTAQRAVLTGLLEEIGGGPAVEKKPAGADATRPTAGTATTGRGGDPSQIDRERVLASVTEALGLTSGDLARALYGDDGPGARAKARVALERWRRTQ